ncbi:hypothetical protein P7K49_015256 [Saguinus oedipus]|uniref:Uncharacterized protein n=1 Tax=Saguinus oedipus TaxID=9490 RepID=A0ABQ9VBI7_SAGOE|nr:hypothetical protein P7K49_015256 [Saguinus oedipus]
MASLKDADAVVISMKFPCGAVVSVDVSQHCTDSCDQRLLVTSLPFSTPHQSTVKSRVDSAGGEPPEITKEQFLRAFRVAVAVEQPWTCCGPALDLPCELAEAFAVKTEAR